ncbi:MAG: asparagine synthase (glutamine-hydrolyzing) [Limisphaerales bacterium]|jgi:asparagine synthase (glutamine-hydrolysing)
MCGIAGYLTPPNHTPSEEELRGMTDALEHRGPDGSGYYMHSRCALGHRRLSILDLSDAASQPMVSHNSRYSMAFNGEIYNFKSIADRLKTDFKSSGDTEVILEAFVQWGPDFVRELNGMFAIAIHDREDDTLWLFRDRVGIKPLYYGIENGTFGFASEIKSFQEIEAFKNKLTLDLEAIGHFLHLSYIPSPWTIYKEIRSMQPGTRGVFRNGEFHQETWWSLSSQIEKEPLADEKTALAGLEERLQQSVEYRMISDVPLGTFLSGGVDSSLVTATAQHLSNKPVQTFSIGFKESQYDESAYAKQVAKHLKTQHHEFTVSQDDALERIEELLDVYDQPYGDSSAIPTMLVSKLARKHVTVALSGDGGDETHLGYGAYTWANRLNNPLIRGARWPIAAGLNLLSNRHKRAAKVFKYPDEAHFKSHVFSQEQFCFARNEIKEVLKPKNSVLFNFEEEFGGLSRKLAPDEAQAFFDLHYYLPDDLLVKVDRASMRFGLEVRVPLLDHKLVEYGLNIDPSLKTKDGSAKYLLKQLLYKHVPESFFNRPKWGFSIPLRIWLGRELAHLVDQHLSKEAVESVGVLNYVVVKKLISDFRNGKDYLYNRIWLLIILQRWLTNDTGIK